jgi:hypothetical protein
MAAPLPVEDCVGSDAPPALAADASRARYGGMSQSPYVAVERASMLRGGLEVGQDCEVELLAAQLLLPCDRDESVAHLGRGTGKYALTVRAVDEGPEGLEIVVRKRRPGTTPQRGRR